MRTFGSRSHPYAMKKRATLSERNGRLAYEWDCSMNIEETHGNVVDTIPRIINILRTAYEDGDLTYVLVSSEECHEGKHAKKFTAAGGFRHVHIALVFKQLQRRKQVIQLLTSYPVKLGEDVPISKYGGSISKIYAVPRKQEYLYLGWWLHHVKMETKVTPDQPIAYEAGKLPVDINTLSNGARLGRLQYKFHVSDTLKDHPVYQQIYGVWKDITKPPVIFDSDTFSSTATTKSPSSIGSN